MTVPQAGLGVMDLATGQIVARIPQVSGYSLVGEGAGLLVYKKSARGEATA